MSSDPRLPKEPLHLKFPRLNLAQIRLIRAKLLLYYETKKGTVLSYGYSWKDLAEQISLYTEDEIPGDTLRQFAKQQISRGRPRGLRPDNLYAVIAFLSHPHIQALSLDELKEPEIPYRFALELMAFLRHDQHSELVVPPPGLEGSYRALRSSRDEIVETRLDIVISAEGLFVQIKERSDSFMQPGIGADPAAWSYVRSRLLKKSTESEGWGIMTPESNLLLFIKRIPYGINHYYAAMGGIPDFTDRNPVEHLALLAYDYPYFCIDHEDTGQWFEKINQKMVSRHLLHFIRIAET